MPKTGIFDDTIQFSAPMELREKITALMYMRGDRDFSAAARNLLYKAVTAEISLLRGEESNREYLGVLANVRDQMAIRRQERAEKAARRAASPE